MANALDTYAQKIATSALPQEKIPFGPWDGSVRSVNPMMVPRNYMTTGLDFLYKPRDMAWIRRKGQTQLFDTFGASTGLLPAKWSSKCRQLDEFISDSISGGVPTVCSLLTKETVASGLDDGWFSTLWIRDQVSNNNYTLGDEYDTVNTYPAPGTTQLYKFVPLWYESGDGGITRGTTEFQRRFFVGGSRSMLKTGKRRYFPSLKGTPSRWDETFTPAAALSAYARPLTASDGSNWGTVVGAGSQVAAIQDTNSDTAGSSYVRFDASTGFGGTLQIDFDNLTTLAGHAAITSGGVLHITQRTSSGYLSQMYCTFRHTDGTPIFSNASFSGDGNATTSDPGGGWWGKVTTSFVVWSITLGAAECAAVDFTKQLRLQIANAGLPGSGTWDIAQVEFQVGGSASATASRLFPSGPIAPTHAGKIVKGNALAGSTTTRKYPESDITQGAWINSTGGAALYSYINDDNSNVDNTYIRTPAGSNTACEVALADFGFPVANDDTVAIEWRAGRFSPVGGVDLTVALVSGTTIITSQQFTLNSSVQQFAYTLTSQQIADTTTAEGSSTWTNLRLRFTTTGASGGQYVFVTLGFIQYEPSGARSLGGWHGSDRFLFSIAYRFDDDSIFMPCIPRLPSTTLASGFNLFTVDSGNPNFAFDKIQWTNMPVPPAGVKRLVLLRTPKINSTTDDNLQLNPHDLRVVWEVDAGVTTYDDYFADDDALGLDVDRLLIRDDHIMPPRARHIFGGDSRVCHSYGGLNPCAIELAPVGAVADYDLNYADTNSLVYGSAHAMYFRIENASGANTQMTLNESDGVTNTVVKTYVFGTGVGQYPTLEALVDIINATSIAAGDGSQWRAQMCPGANPQASTLTALTPHTRAITSCVVSGQTITRAAGGLSKVAVGNFVSGTGVTLGAYITRIDSDTQLTFVGTISPATITCTFYVELGDAPTAATANSGYQRVIANSLPGFIYFNKTYLNTFPIQKSTVWMTVASPGATKSAPNCFSGLISNRHTPPLEAGISMGGVGIDNGFVVPFAKKTAVIRNTRQTGSGVDQDYKLFIMNEAGGCCGPVVQGNRCAFFFAPEGWMAADLHREMLLSEAIYVHAPVPTGDFSYEGPLCVAAAGSDTDTGYMCARVMNGALWVSYRGPTGSPTRPDKQVVYDFSSGQNSSGLESLHRAPGRLWGWSLPLVRAVTQMTEGRRADGSHMYGWNEANAGSTGDGRIDEIEVTDQDNGTNISASILTPWERANKHSKLSVQELTVEHSSPTGATVFLDFVRSFEVDTYTLTPSTSSTLVVSRDVKMLPLAARSPTAAFYVGWRQTAGSASELRPFEVRAKVLPSFT